MDQSPDVSGSVSGSPSPQGGNDAHSVIGNGNGNGAEQSGSAPPSKIPDDPGFQDIPAIITMPTGITNKVHKPLMDEKIPDPKNPRQWLRQFFETDEGRALILNRVKVSDQVLLHCVDRAYGKVKDLMDVTHRSALANRSEEELRAIVTHSP